MKQSKAAAESTRVIKDALSRACEALSEIVQARFKPNEIEVSFHDPLELPSLWAGSEETAVYAAFYEVKGDLSGYLLLVIPFSDIGLLIQALLGGEGGDEAMVDSALGEVGNIVGSTFLNHLADYFRISAAPTPPQVVRDMMGALLETLAAVAASEGKSHVPVIRTSFAHDEEAVTAFLLWITDAEALTHLGERT